MEQADTFREEAVEEDDDDISELPADESVIDVNILAETPSSSSKNSFIIIIYFLLLIVD